MYDLSGECSMISSSDLLWDRKLQVKSADGLDWVVHWIARRSPTEYTDLEGLSVTEGSSGPSVM